MNKPDDFDCWRLPDDGSVAKVTIAPETKIPNAATLVIEREDHTLGNILRMQLLEDKEVHFAGYRVPHPLEPAIQIKVQTRSNNPGPIDAVDSALIKLTNELTALSSSFEKSLKAYAQRTGAHRAGASGDMDVE
ncbi:RNA polymerase ii core subunit [Chrysochromulina tobinii]|uniref:RNA polymerase ii core subunit n=1 Tax=Chrysochromulina tobinii TaxID=1460289 RepID=A0A0M0JR29_9EUKA|nr:RNA polymerase ii core subunit [Chrysochromulina tobinii]|eukprot:KOO28713.1 RNA polymerase ii core subunit [Chrysochromulina sp. CCMP291]